MSDPRVSRLAEEAVARRYPRRDLVRRAAALGLAVPAVAATLSGADSEPALAQDASNPLDVDPNAPLDVVIFKGGYGDDYAKYVNDRMYKKLYPDAEITYAGIQDLIGELGSRFADGNPPDVVDNSGGGRLLTADLVANDQLADLADLMAAPAYDTAGKTFAETLLPGTQDLGVFGGRQLVLNWALTVVGVWYSSSFLTAKGYTYPTTWDGMLDLCAELSGSGVAPWMTTGLIPFYVRSFVFDQMLYKHDPQAAVAIDNLEPDAWKQPAVQEVLEALYLLADRGYLAPGWQGLDHIQSQEAWLQGDAVFLPCGSWLGNEMEDVTPPGFDMVVAPTPSLPGDKLPFEGIIASGGEAFIVPAQAKNVQGGKEWLRLLFSKEGGRFFAENTGSPSVVQGSGEGLALGTAFASTLDAVEAAGANTFPTSSYVEWYVDLEQVASDQMGALLRKQVSIDEFVDTVQAAADAVKDNDAIPKYHRTK